MLDFVWAILGYPQSAIVRPILIIIIMPVSEPLPRKQSFWDRPGILASRAVVASSISDSVQMATFLAASAPHSGDWLLALPVSSCGLRLSDDAVRVAVSLSLGCSICMAHTCRCGAMVDVRGNMA